MSAFDFLILEDFCLEYFANYREITVVFPTHGKIRKQRLSVFERDGHFLGGKVTSDGTVTAVLKTPGLTGGKLETLLPLLHPF